MLKLLHNRTPIDLVILTAAWGHLPGDLVLADSDMKLNDTGLRLMENGFNDLLPRLSAPGRRVLLLGLVPSWNLGSLPGPCAFADISLPRRPCGMEKPYFTNVFFSTPVHNILQAAAERAHDVVYLPEKDLCIAGKCLAFINDEFIYYDQIHLRRDLSESTKEKVIDLLHLESFVRIPCPGCGSGCADAIGGICCISGKGCAARRLRPAQAIMPKICYTKDGCVGVSPLGTARTCPLASIAIASPPASVRFAVQKP